MNTNLAILIAAAAAAIVAVLGAIGAGLGVVGVFLVNNRASKSVAKKSDLQTLEDSYKHLQLTYEGANATLNDELAEERLARQADKLACQTQIAGLQAQLTALLHKLPEPGALVPVVIAGLDTAALASMPVVITGAGPAVELPVVIKGSLPLPMTAAQAQAKADELADAEASTVTEQK